MMKQCNFYWLLLLILAFYTSCIGSRKATKTELKQESITSINSKGYSNEKIVYKDSIRIVMDTIKIPQASLYVDVPMKDTSFTIREKHASATIEVKNGRITGNFSCDSLQAAYVSLKERYVEVNNQLQQSERNDSTSVRTTEKSKEVQKTGGFWQDFQNIIWCAVTFIAGVIIGYLINKFSI